MWISTANACANQREAMVGQKYTGVNGKQSLLLSYWVEIDDMGS